MHYEDLYVGAQVLVGNGEDLTTEMVKYKNTVVTISKLIAENDIRIVEDEGAFSWYTSDFAELIDGTEEPDVEAIVNSFASLMLSEV